MLQPSSDTVAAMNTWLTIRTSIALFLVISGVGLAFSNASDGRVLIGSLFVTIGLTFFLRVALALGEK